ncbi:hypothetical protein A7E78_04500 [Syntrophotalea acetylenivorans]|uniref:Uncharacterized protein n=1 Tax=Syntrophotalea acetylenivorans TaxID=1842532 RepID=A0A1L3GMJ5_9BACT|nr:hypothetical protein A7E78_04500 [Syntrophotalea acetylenivorans]
MAKRLLSQRVILPENFSFDSSYLGGEVMSACRSANAIWLSVKRDLFISKIPPVVNDTQQALFRSIFGLICWDDARKNKENDKQTNWMPDKNT